MTSRTRMHGSDTAVLEREEGRKRTPGIPESDPDLAVHSDLKYGSISKANVERLKEVAGAQLNKLDPATLRAVESPTVPPDEHAKAEHVGVINPFALAELRAGRSIDFTKEDPRTVLPEVLGVPYEQLFDPKNHSMLYPGLKYDSHAKRVTVEKEAMNPEKFINILIHGNDVPMITWKDPGHFFTDAAQFTDPIQGNLADCYFIAALTSVAWARPLLINERTRPIGQGGQFGTPAAVDVISFYDGSGAHNVETTELLPETNGSLIYARADDPTELWPPVYEKAYVKWRTNDSGDQPNFPAINYGDTVAAGVQLTGLAPSYFPTHQIIDLSFLGIHLKFDLVSADQIWQTVRANSLGGKTVNPMMAWTYGSASDAPDPIDYGSAHIVANHAYSILGWMYENNQEYVVLRNPWGSTESTLNVAGGTWSAYDGTYWRSTQLSAQGVFALRADTFKQYYAGFGAVK